MNAAQMDKEFDIVYESIASNGAPGYQPFEKSVLLTQAQHDIIQELVESGLEKSDIRSLVIGPHIKTTSFSGYTKAYINPEFTDDIQGGDSINATWDAGDENTGIAVVNASPTSLSSTGSTAVLDVGVIVGIEISSAFVSPDDGPTISLDISGVGIQTIDADEIVEGAEFSGTITTSGSSSIVIQSIATVLGDGFDIAVYTKTPTFEESEMYNNGISFELDTSSMWLLVNERVKETSSSTPIEVKPVDHAFLDVNIYNPFKKPQTGRSFWRVLQYGETAALFTTPKFLVLGLSGFETYYINYLEKPTPIFVPGITAGDTLDGVTVSGTPGNNDIAGIGDDIDIVTNGLNCGYNSIIHRDIVNRAAKLGAAYVGDPEGFQLLLNSHKGN